MFFFSFVVKYVPSKCANVAVNNSVSIELVENLKCKNVDPLTHFNYLKCSWEVPMHYVLLKYCIAQLKVNTIEICMNSMYYMLYVCDPECEKKH